MNRDTFPSFIPSRFPVLRGKTRPVSSVLFIQVLRACLVNIHIIHDMHVQFMFIHGARW
jgi:hypothetical protein